MKKIVTHKELLEMIEEYLALKGIKPHVFGKEVLNGFFESEITTLSIINFTKGVYFIKTDLPQVGVFPFIFQ